MTVTKTMKKTYIFLCILILFITTPAFAESKRQRFTFLPEFGGLNTSVSPLILDPKQLVTANNVIYDHVGSRKKRGGLLYLNESSMSPTESSGSNNVMGLFDFRKIDSTGNESRKLIAHSGGKVYKMDAFAGTFDEISSGPLTVDIPVDYAVLRKVDTVIDTVIMVNGAELPQTWNQSADTVSNLTGYPTGIDFYPSAIEAHRSRLFATGVPSYPYRIYFSAEFKHDDWNTGDDAGYADIIDRFAGRITGLVGNYYDYLIVFTEYSIYKISGSSYANFAATPTPIQSGIGAVNNAGIVPFGNDIFFVSKKGIHSLATIEQYGDIRETYLSASIQADFNRLKPDRLKYCCGAVWPALNYIIWSFSDGASTENDICFVYDYIGKRWSKWTGINASSFIVAQTASGVEELVCGDNNGFVQRMNREDYTDNGSAYTMTWTTPYISFGDPVINKAFKHLFVFMKPQGTSDLSVSYRVGNLNSNELTFSQEGTSGTLGSFVLGTDTLGGGTLVPRGRRLKGDGKTIQLTFEQSTVHGSEEYGFTIEAIPTQVDYSQ